jgi:hypothetical protein
LCSSCLFSKTQSRNLIFSKTISFLIKNDFRLPCRLKKKEVFSIGYQEGEKEGKEGERGEKEKRKREKERRKRKKRKRR